MQEWIDAHNAHMTVPIGEPPPSVSTASSSRSKPEPSARNMRKPTESESSNNANPNSADIPPETYIDPNTNRVYSKMASGKVIQIGF